MTGTLITTVAAGFAAVGCAATHSNTTLDDSWANAYPTVGQMVRHSDAVVEGSVTGIQGTQQQSGMPFTDFAFHVDRWINGQGSATQIIIHQTGAQSNGHVVAANGDPLLQPGEHDILFLKKYAQDRYYILGGPTGRFKVQNGTASALPSGLIHKGMPISVNSFLQRIGKSG